MVEIKKNKYVSNGGNVDIILNDEELKNNTCNICGQQIKINEECFFCENCYYYNLKSFLFHKKCIKIYNGPDNFPCNHTTNHMFKIEYILGKIKGEKNKEEIIEILKEIKLEAFQDNPNTIKKIY